MRLKHCPGCGLVLVKERSPKAHRLFFAVIDKAFQNWPESFEGLQPDCSEHLRAWLLVKAGYRDVLHNSDVDFIKNVITYTRERGYGFPAEHSGGLAVAFPRSVNWQTLDQKAFNPVAEKVYAIIEEIIGVPIKELRDKANDTL